MNVSAGVCMHVHICAFMCKLTFSIFLNYSAYYIIIVDIVIIRQPLLLNLELVSLGRMPMQ